MILLLCVKTYKLLQCNKHIPQLVPQDIKATNEEDKAEVMVTMIGNSFTSTGSSILVNKAATICVMNSRKIDYVNNKVGWIVDSGETCHITSKLSELNIINDSNRHIGRKVHLSNGQTTTATYSGRSNLPIRDVLGMYGDA